MIINPSLPADTSAADLQNNRPAGTPPGALNANSAAASADTTATSDRMRELSLAGQEDDWTAQDSAAADGWTSFLSSNIVSQAGTALAAQANPNPEMAFSLLQS